MIRTPAVLILLLLATGACRGAGANDPSPEAPVTTTPVIQHASDLSKHDGEVVQLVGTYRKRMVQKKMNDPTKHFFGFVDVELEGLASDYDPARGSVPAKVGLDGRRDDDEVEQYADAPVEVTGKLVVDPSSNPDVASTAPLPTLYDVTSIEKVE